MLLGIDHNGRFWNVDELAALSYPERRDRRRDWETIHFLSSRRFVKIKGPFLAPWTFYFSRREDEINRFLAPVAEEFCLSGNISPPDPGEIWQRLFVFNNWVFLHFVAVRAIDSGHESLNGA